MSIQINQDGSLSITAMSLVEFLPDVVQAVKDGYILDMEKNEGYPQQVGFLTTVTMYKPSIKKEKPAEVIAPNTVYPSAEDIPKVDGRRKKI
jgi:hypothetical protein